MGRLPLVVLTILVLSSSFSTTSAESVDAYIVKKTINSHRDRKCSALPVKWQLICFVRYGEARELADLVDTWETDLLLARIFGNYTEVRNIQNDIDTASYLIDDIIQNGDKFHLDRLYD